MKMIGLAFFVYKRPECTAKVIESIKKNHFEKIYIFQDGLKDEKDRKDWDRVSELIKAINFTETEIHISEQNKGLANSIIAGMDYVFKKHNTAIALEDDALLGERYKDFMTACFEKYKDDMRVMSISGGNFINVPKDYPYDICYLYRMCSLGFGTWRDRWAGFERDPRILTEILSDPEKSQMLNMAGEFKHYVTLSILKKIDTWATYWALYQINSKAYHIAPKEIQAVDIGRTGNGTNSKSATYRFNTVMGRKEGEWKFPDKFFLDERITKSVKKMLSIASPEEKYKNYYDILNKWLSLSMTGISLSEYFADKGIDKIYIYGAADIAGHLYDDIYSNVRIESFIVETKTIGSFRGVHVSDMYDDEELIKSVPIVITPSHVVETIEYIFNKRGIKNSIILINEVVDYLYEKYLR